MQKNKKKLEIKYLILIILLIILLFLLVFSYTLKKGRKLSPIEQIIKDTIVGTERIVYAPIKYTINLINDFHELKNIKKENDILRDNLEKMDYINTNNIELKREIASLKDELNITYVLSEYEYLNASIISRNIGYWYNTITIDKGGHNGLTTDMAVVNSKGLIGKIVSTTNFTSDIRLLTTTDTSNKVSVTVTNGDNTLNGLIYGYNYEENYFLVEGISNTEKVNINDAVYTSGLGGIFPSGIAIGTVMDIATDEYGLSKIIKVTPSANFNDLNYVTILKRKDQKK